MTAAPRRRIRRPFSWWWRLMMAITTLAVTASLVAYALATGAIAHTHGVQPVYAVFAGIGLWATSWAACASSIYATSHIRDWLTTRRAVPTGEAGTAH